MTSNQHTRRTYLQALGSIGLTSTLPTTARGTSHDPSDVDPSALLIPPAAVPTQFVEYDDPEEKVLLEVLHTESPALNEAATAVQTYTAGADHENPEWVIGSVAIVSDKSPDRERVRTAIVDCLEEYSASYNADILPGVECTTTTTDQGQSFDWRLDLTGTRKHVAEAVTATAFTELHRYQYHGPILIGTFVFGPRTGTPEVGAFLEQYAALQHRRVQERKSAL